MDHGVRRYLASDEGAWLRCRVLAFLGTAYFDDVQTAKPAVPPPGLELVATDSSGEIRGIQPIKAFLHTKLDEEATIRKHFARVHVCRRFTQNLSS